MYGGPTDGEREVGSKGEREREMRGWIHGTHEWMDTCMHGYMEGCINLCMDAWMGTWMHGLL